VVLVSCAALGWSSPGHAVESLPGSCADAGATFEQASASVTEYTFESAGHVVEAEGVSWLGIEGEVLSLLGSEEGCWSGGSVDGPYDDTSVYECSRTHCPGGVCPDPCLAYHTTACMAPGSSGGQGIEDFECAHYGDGISREFASGDLVIRRVHLHDLNDDAIEDDYGLSSTRLFDSLIDGVQLAFGDRQRSSQNNDATGTEWEVRDSLVRVRADQNPYKQRPGHAGFWKGDRVVTHQHRYRLTDNVFVAQGQKGGGLLFPVVGYVDECTGNTLLWAGPLDGSGGWNEALADQSDFTDGLTDGERLVALNEQFPGCFTVVLKPADQTEAAFLGTPLAELDGKSWNQRVAEWKTGEPTPSNTPPAVSITTPAAGTTVNVGTSLDFAASASDLEDGDLSVAITWSSSLDGGLGVGASLTLASLSVGTHVVTASVTDAGGLAADATVTVIVSGAPANTAPAVSITAPAEGTTVSAGTPIDFAASASDPEDGDLSAAITWSSSLDGGLGVGASLTLASLSVGTHAVTASVTDAGGLAASATVTVTVTEPAPPANTTPLVSITSPAESATVSAGTPIVFAASASDAEDGDLSAAITWTSDRDGILGTGASLTVSLRAKGTHVITATVTDSGGAVGQAKRNVRVKR